MGDGDQLEVELSRALRGNEERIEPYIVQLGHMQDAGELPSADDFTCHDGDVD